jgi:hypothetical protein
VTIASPNYLRKKTTLTVYQRLAVTGLIVLIYLVACCCPALTFDNYYSGNTAPQSTETWFGWTTLLLGWLGILVGSVAWLANFVLGLTLIFLMCGLRWATLISSAVTFLLSLDFSPIFSANIPATKAVLGERSCDHLESVCGFGLLASPPRSLEPGSYFWRQEPLRFLL